MAEEKTVKVPHSLILENRKMLTATGISNVDSFNEQEIVACTDLGDLIVKGSKLHIDKLNIETGELTIDGEVVSMTYTGNQISGGFFSRLFK